MVVVEEPQEDPRITEMREATQQIMFIDSLVVEKNLLLPHIQLHPESGKITTYDQFFHSEGHDGYVFVNEMGNKCYFSDENDNGRMRLFTSDKLGKEWSEPALVKGISEGITEANYPFMMTDGTTFYFAAKGQESIGGYDIFVTRYDSEDGQFLKPENIGMPFNSEANDYLYVIDEQNNIGFFVTDRRQPAGKVCVYVFIPPTARQTYNLDMYSDEKLRSLSEIRCIADTWGDGKERKQALERLKSTPNNVAQQTKSEINFVINDQVTYTSASQFRSPESQSLYRQLTDTKKKLSEIRSTIEKSRTYYVKANAEDKRVLRTEILDGEDEILRLTAQVNTLEKKIRNAENIIINPSK
ncbi:MAG: hypothetical protein J5658_13190 [Prevotella sp.]|nr:hypothetical protein [Prevotella sp.]